MDELSREQIEDIRACKGDADATQYAWRDNTQIINALCKQALKYQDAKADAGRLKGLRELLCGYIESGDGDFVTIGQDDATREWLLKLSYAKKIYSAPSFAQVIDAAIDQARGAANGQD